MSTNKPIYVTINKNDLSIDNIVKEGRRMRSEMEKKNNEKKF